MLVAILATTCFHVTCIEPRAVYSMQVHLEWSGQELGAACGFLYFTTKDDIKQCSLVFMQMYDIVLLTKGIGNEKDWGWWGTSTVGSASSELIASTAHLPANCLLCSVITDILTCMHCFHCHKCNLYLVSIVTKVATLGILQHAHESLKLSCACCNCCCCKLSKPQLFNAFYRCWLSVCSLRQSSTAWIEKVNLVWKVVRPWPEATWPAKPVAIAPKPLSYPSSYNSLYDHFSKQASPHIVLQTCYYDCA